MKCESCGEESAATRTWKRVAMGYDRAQLCAPCDARWRRDAADRAPDATEYFRLLELQSRLAGEVWESDSVAFWFETPPLYRPVLASDPMLRIRARPD